MKRFSYLACSLLLATTVCSFRPVYANDQHQLPAAIEYRVRNHIIKIITSLRAQKKISDETIDILEKIENFIITSKTISNDEFIEVVDFLESISLLRTNGTEESTYSEQLYKSLKDFLLYDEYLVENYNSDDVFKSTMTSDLLMDNQTQVQFGELDASGTAYVAIQAPADLTSGTGTYTLTLPLNDGNANQVLTTDGSGVLSWADTGTTAGYFINNGNSFGTAAVLGTNDANSLNFETSGVTRMTIDTTGDISIAGGNLDIPITTSTAGSITQNGTRILHTFGPDNLGSDNAFYGYSAGNLAITGQANVGIGREALISLTSGLGNVALGAYAAPGITTGESNTLLGAGTGGNLVSGSNNIIIGAYADSNNATSNSIILSTGGYLNANNQIKIGFGSVASTNTFIDGITGTNTATPSSVTIVDTNGQLGTDAATINLAIGAVTTALNIGTNATNKIITIGSDADTINLDGVVDIPTTTSTAGLITQNGTRVLHTFGPDNLGSDNAFYGYSAGNLAITGQANVGIGREALISLTSGLGNVALGAYAAPGITTGESNTLLGAGTGGNLVSGSNNIIIGAYADSNNATSNSIILSTGGYLNANNQIKIGFGSVASTNTFIDGIRGTTTGVANAITVLIDSAGQLGTVSSSRRYKENIIELPNTSEQFMELNPVQFNYQSDASQTPQYGLIAEEVEPLYPDLVVYNSEGEIETIKYHLLYALLIQQIQENRRLIEELQAQHA